MKEMNNINKTKITTILSISMILIMIGMMVLPSAMAAPVDSYTVEVSSGQSTSITTTTDVTFGALNPGTDDNEIADSFGLTNVGNTDCTVSATFSTNVGAIYGLVNTTYVIGGGNFSMRNTVGTTPTYVDLDNLSPATSMTTDNDVLADEAEDTWSVTLDIPAGQYAAIYTGTVELTFADTA